MGYSSLVGKAEYVGAAGEKDAGERKGLVGGELTLDFFHQLQWIAQLLDTCGIWLKAPKNMEGFILCPSGFQEPSILCQRDFLGSRPVSKPYLIIRMHKDLAGFFLLPADLSQMPAGSAFGIFTRFPIA